MNDLPAMLACACWWYSAAIVVVGLVILGAFFTWRNRRKRAAPDPS